jgi:hypothetical protein
MLRLEGDSRLFALEAVIDDCTVVQAEASGVPPKPKRARDGGFHLAALDESVGRQPTPEAMLN